MRSALGLSAALVLYGLLRPPWWAYIPLNLTLAASLFLLARRRGFTLQDLGVQGASLRKGVRLGLAAAGTTLLVLTVGGLLARFHPQAGEILADRGAGTFVHPGLAYEVLLRIPLGTVLVETVVFHGVLFGALLRARGMRAAIVVTSVAFGLWHIGPTLTMIQELPRLVHPVAAVAIAVAVTTLGGAVFGWMRKVTGSLAAPALAHYSLNAIGLTLVYWLHHS